MMQPPIQEPIPAPKLTLTWREAALGIMNANVLAALLMSLVVSTRDRAGGYYGTAATVIIPLLMGFLAGATWRKLELSVRQIALLVFLNSLVALACAYLFLHEGVICLVMAYPLLFALLWAGTALGIKLLRPKGGNRPVAVSLVPLLLFALIYDCAQPEQEDARRVTTSVIVHAPAARVFPHLVAFSRITVAPTFFLHRIGMPYPMETTADGAFVGAKRVCRFSDGIAIGERITTLEPGRTVAFTIIEQPMYPEFTQHGQLAQGVMTVRDNGDGTATLTGTSWYSLRVHPFWYFGMWADEVIHAVHGRVFTHIRALSEH